MFQLNTETFNSINDDWIAREVDRAILRVPPIATMPTQIEVFELARQAFTFHRSDELLNRLWRSYEKQDSAALDWLVALAVDRELTPSERARCLCVLASLN